MSESDHDYFLRRAAEERAAAEKADKADNADAGRSHLELAHRYEAAAAALRGVPVVQLRAGSAGAIPEAGNSRRKA
jgi:hypothetical protein